MKIVQLTWARLWDGAARAGGSNGYLAGLTLALAERGHDVTYVSSGTTYEDDLPDGSPAPCRLVRHADWRGIRVFEVVNSPVLAPAIAQFRDPLGDVSAPALERLLAGLFDRLEPDVVHVHNIEGFSAGCVDAARAARSRPRVVFSLHTYHPVCSQAVLVQGHSRPCPGFDNGHACVGCVPAFDPPEARRVRVLAARRQPVVAVDPSRPESVTAPLPPLDPDVRAVVVADPRDPRVHMPPDSPGGVHAWFPVDNVARADPPSDKEPNAYGIRRAAMVAMLNRCDRVIAVSRFVREKYRVLGVRPDVLSTMYIGTTMPDLVAAQPLPPPPPAPPVRVAFLGFNVWHKGLPLLADALAMLPGETLSRLHLSVYAGGGYGLSERFAPVEPRLAGLLLQQWYEYDDVPRLLAGAHLGVVPSVWWDNAPQTVMEMLACGVPVLGARLGGIPDFVVDGHNGLLFQGNDPADLARRLAEVAAAPETLDRLRRNVRPPKTMREHVAEMERVYAGVAVEQDSPFPPSEAVSEAELALPRPYQASRVS